MMESAVHMEYALVLDVQGALKPAQASPCPMSPGEGSVEALIGTSLVLSDLRGAERNRLEAPEMLERARTEMEQYLAFAAHDLRTPLRRMSGLAALIQDELPESATEARSLVAMIEDVSRTAQKMINEVLNFSEANNAPVRMDSVDLHLLARDVFTVLDPLHKHDLTADAVFLSADRVALQIILRNLVDNAIKHADKRVIRLHVGLDSGPEGMALLVTDNGPGLPDGDLRFLDGQGFEYGTGFGLLGIRRMITSRGGQLTATPAPGGGTRFRVTLPGLARITR